MIVLDDTGTEGVLFSQGSAAGGYPFFIKDGKLRYVHNYVGRELFGVESEVVVPAGKHELRFQFEPTGEPDISKGREAHRRPRSRTTRTPGTTVRVTETLDE